QTGGAAAAVVVGAGGAADRIVLGAEEDNFFRFALVLGDAVGGGLVGDVIFLPRAWRADAAKLLFDVVGGFREVLRMVRVPVAQRDGQVRDRLFQLVRERALCRRGGRQGAGEGFSGHGAGDE